MKSMDRVSMDVKILNNGVNIMGKKCSVDFGTARDVDAQGAKM